MIKINCSNQFTFLKFLNKASTCLFNSKIRKMSQNGNNADGYDEAGFSGEHNKNRNRLRPPPHLRGKAIGLWYARNQGKGFKKEKKSKQKEKVLTPLSMDRKKEEKINNLFENIGKREKYDSRSSSGYNLSAEYASHLNGSAFQETGVVLDSALNQNADLDLKLFNNLNEKDCLQKYQAMYSFRSHLPAFKLREHIIKMIEAHQVLVIMGETGCGKTTQVPQFILDSYIASQKGSLCKIICTQPRRISAISVAERVADERCVRVGHNSDVGYQIRLESEMPRREGSILFCTTGIILQQLQNNPYLLGISHIIVDEVHERSLDSDFLLISLKDIMSTRKDLKIILMSATLNAKEFSGFFDNCPMISIPGYTFPVQIFMLEDMIEKTHYSPRNSSKRKQNVPQIAQIKMSRKERAERESQREEYLKTIAAKYSKHTLNTLKEWNESVIDLDLIVDMLYCISTGEKEGAVLVFLPGWAQINKLNSLLNENLFFKSDKFIILPLHSLLPTLNQKLVFEKPRRGVRKIILATNIAETSITIDDIVYVIDSGQIKMKSFDHKNNVQLLQPEWVALSNMKQREGRAGRTQPGICFHMFTKFKESELESYQLPEMLRTSLEETILKIKILKLGKAAPYLNKAINPPDSKIVELSLHTLRRLNALNDDENLTPLGYHLAKLPMDPHTGKMILFGCIFSCLDPILSIAASLSFKDAFVIPLGKEDLVDRMKKEISNKSFSDHIAFANAIQEWEIAEENYQGQQYCWEHFLSFSTLRMLKNLKHQYTQYLKDLHFIKEDDPKYPAYNINSDNLLLLKAIICAGLYPNVAKVCNKDNPVINHGKFRKPSLKALTEDGQKVSLHPKSVNASEPYIKTGWLVYHLKVKSSDIFLHDSTAVTPYSLLFFGGNLKVNKIKASKHETIEIVSVDNWIEFQCQERKAKLVLDLRQELDNLLEYKITNPGPTNWSEISREGKVLKCIIELITSEETLASQRLQID